MDWRIIDESLDLLEQGEVEKAWDLARRAVAKEPEAPAAWFALSQAAAALGEFDAALKAVGEVLLRTEELGGDDRLRHEALLTGADVCWQRWRFAEAEEYARKALELDSGSAEAWYLLGLILEFQERQDEAEKAFRKAAQLDPEQYPLPAGISEEELNELIDEVFAALPPELARATRDVAVVVRDLPTWELVEPEGDEEPMPPDVLGLFVGTPLEQRGQAAWDEPPKIFLFRRNLERAFVDREELRDEILTTVKHELAHYLGFDEAEMRGLGIE